MMDNEECWVLKGKCHRRWWIGEYDAYSTGLPASVVFDGDYVWENRKEIVGWLHTHPHWVASPSAIDDATMWAQILAIGKPLVCCIIGTDGLRAWWYFEDGVAAREVVVKNHNGILTGLTLKGQLSKKTRRTANRITGQN